MADPTLKQLQAQLDALQGQWNLKFGSNPANLFQQDPTLGTGPQSQLQRPHVVVVQSVNQVLNVAPTTLNFGTDIYNPLGGMHDIAGNPDKLFAPVAGVYLVVGELSVLSVNAGATVLFNIVPVTVPTNLQPFASVRNATAGDEITLNLAAVLRMNALDYVVFQGSVSAGGPSTAAGNTYASLTQIF